MRKQRWIDLAELGVGVAGCFLVSLLLDRPELVDPTTGLAVSRWTFPLIMLGLAWVPLSMVLTKEILERTMK